MILYIEFKFNTIHYTPACNLLATVQKSDIHFPLFFCIHMRLLLSKTTQLNLKKISEMVFGDVKKV